MSWSNKDTGYRAYLIGIVMVAALGISLLGYHMEVIWDAEKGLQAFFMEARDFQYTNGWHRFTMWSALAGCAVGAVLSGMLVRRIGRKGMLVLGGLLLFVSALGCMNPEFLFFNDGKPTRGVLVMLNIYRIIGGIGAGIALVSSPAYINDLSIFHQRWSKIGITLLSVIMGIFVAWIVNSCILSDHIQPLEEEMGRGIAALNPASQWTMAIGWRYMFGAEAIPAELFMLLACFLPEKTKKKKEK